MISERKFDWAPLRQAFIERSPRPTYTELGEEFGITTSAVGKCSNEENWPALREAALERKLQKCDAQSVLLEAVQVDRTFIRKFANLGFVTLDKLTSTVESIQDARAAQTKAQALHTCMFAAFNLAKSLHEAGIIGVSKTLDMAGKEDNGRWNPGLLQQINVTVQNLTDKAREAGVVLPTSAPDSPEPTKNEFQ